MLTRAQYTEEALRALIYALGEAPDALRLIMPALVDIVKDRDLRDVLLNALWTTAMKQGYDGHEMKHWLHACGVEVPDDIPQKGEP